MGATQNLYNPEVVTLVGGLDFVTPRPQVAPGSLIDCFNYEVADRLGYKRIDGYESYDPSYPAHLVYTNSYTADYSVTSGGDPNVGEFMWLSTDNSSKAFGLVQGTDTIDAVTVVLFTIINSSVLSTTLAQVTNVDTEVTTSAAKTLSLSNFRKSNIAFGLTTPSEQVEWFNKNITTGQFNVISNLGLHMYTAQYGRSFGPSYTIAGDIVHGAVDTTVPHGLGWYNNQLYNIIDLPSITFTGASTKLHPNDIVSNGTSYILVRQSSKLSGDYTTGTAVLQVLYSVIDSSATYSSSGIYFSKTSHTATYGTVKAIGVTLPGALTLYRSGAGTSLTMVVATDTRPTTPIAYDPPIYAGLFRQIAFTDAVNPSATGAPTGYGTEQIEQGYIIQFNTGTSDGPPKPVGRDPNPKTATTGSTPNASSNNVYEGAPSSVTTDAGHSLVYQSSNPLAPSTGTWDWRYGITAGVNGHPEKVLQGAGTIATDSIGSLGAANPYGHSLAISCKGFSFPDVPPDAIITGITVTIKGYELTTGKPQVAAVVMSLSDAVDSTKTQVSAEFATPAFVSTSVAAPDTYTIGGTHNLWGLTLTPDNLSSLELDVRFRGTKSEAGSPPPQAAINTLQVTVYYTTSSSVLYFYNPDDVNDVRAIVSNTYVESGDWSTNNAAGKMQVVNVTPLGGSNRNGIMAGNQIWNGPGGTGLRIGTVTSDMIYAGLPSKQLIDNVNSQYQIITANFYANPDWESMYGVSGAGRAWVYDGIYFRYVFTGTTETLDKPRHVAFDNFHLVLGYSSGTLLTSAIGDPENFSGVDQAGEFSTGDAITGLLKLDGTTLGVFCRNSIWGLSGTDNSNFSMNVLQPYEGAIEYTVVDCGKPIYASYRGISTFDPSAGYGNFVGGRLSANMTPWLVPRLTSQPSSPIPNGPKLAFAVRNKNQYRIWFNDGYVLTMTLMGQEQSPVFTIQRLGAQGNIFSDIFGNITDISIVDVGVTPYAACTGIDASGRDRIFISGILSGVQEVGDGTTTPIFSLTPTTELDVGWGFNGDGIPAFATTTHNFLDNPFTKSTMRKMRVHGQSKGEATITADVSADYLFGDFKYGNRYNNLISNSSSQDISLPRGGDLDPTIQLTSDFLPYTNILNFAKEGRSFAIQFFTGGYKTGRFIGPTPVLAFIPEPPHILQSLMFQITQNKADV